MPTMRRLIISTFAISIAFHASIAFAFPAKPTTFDTTSSETPVNKSVPLNAFSHEFSATPASSCIRAFSHTPFFKISTFLWTVHIPGQMMPSAQGTGEWGGGFLDNLRRNCGDIISWTAQPDAIKAPNTGIQTMFYSPVCTLQNVQDAAYAASDPKHRVTLHCEFPHSGGTVIPVDEVGDVRPGPYIA